MKMVMVMMMGSVLGSRTVGHTEERNFAHTKLIQCHTQHYSKQEDGPLHRICFPVPLEVRLEPRRQGSIVLGKVATETIFAHVMSLNRLLLAGGMLCEPTMPCYPLIVSREAMFSRQPKVTSVWRSISFPL